MSEKADPKGARLLAKVFHDLVSGKTSDQERRLIELIHRAVDGKIRELDDNIYTLAKSSLEISERVTVLEDVIDEVLAEPKELPLWVH